MSVKVRKRDNVAWWQEASEMPMDTIFTGKFKLQESSQKELEEKYDANRLKPGWSGKDAPSVEKMGSGYAKSGDYDKLGAGSSGASKPKKGDGTKEPPKVKETKKRVSEADDEDLDMPDEDFEDQDQDINTDLNAEEEVPPEMGEEDFEGEENPEEVAQDVTVMIDGKEYTLVPKETEAPEEGEEGEENLENEELGNEEEPSEADLNGGVAGEDKDITQESKGKKVDYDKLIESTIAKRNSKKNKAREMAIRKALRIKKMAEKQLTELFTGEYVTNKQGETGFDFTDVGGDESFAVVDRAASGNQYSPTNSKSVYEPTDKGGKTGHMKTPKGATQEALRRKAAFKAWLKEHESQLKESDSDPGEDSESFNRNDKGLNSMDYEEFPEIPEKMGKEDDLLTNAGSVSEHTELKKVQQRRNLRRQREREQEVKFPSQEVKEDLEDTMEESFDFKKFLNGGYNKRISE